MNQGQDSELLLRDISDTALWAAVFRARETERDDALFRDPYAKRLAGVRGEQITDTLKHAGENSWAWVMRTYLFDQIISAPVKDSVDLVVNLAAGLDARPYRMALPPELRWVEVDLPHLIAYKQEILEGEKPRCALERVSVLFVRPGSRAKHARVPKELESFPDEPERQSHGRCR
jgi:methyltransferase (TIGR00027 family)